METKYISLIIIVDKKEEKKKLVKPINNIYKKRLTRTDF
jgi:hypothetical protein